MSKAKSQVSKKTAKAQDAPPTARKPTRLGKGLSALMAHPVQAFPPVSADTPSTGATDSTTTQPHTVSSQSSGQPTATDPKTAGLTYITLDAIGPNPHQPRQSFPGEALQRLADSIRADGLMQPIIVRPIRSGNRDTTGSEHENERRSLGVRGYELVAGERRLRAAQIAGLKQLPAIVRPLDDRQSAQWALVENLQREDLNPIDRAQAFQSLQNQFGLSHDEIAQQVSIERSTVSNLFRLLNLCDYAQRLIRDGLLSAGQAKALLAVTDHEQQQLLAQRIVAQGWSVRQVEQEVRRIVAGQGGVAGAALPGRPKSATPTHLRDLEQQIGRQLGTKAKLRSGRKKGSGTLSIEFYSLDQFDALMQRMDVNVEMD